MKFHSLACNPGSSKAAASTPAASGDPVASAAGGGQARGEDVGFTFVSAFAAGGLDFPRVRCGRGTGNVEGSSRLHRADKALSGCTIRIRGPASTIPLSTDSTLRGGGARNRPCNLVRRFATWSNLGSPGRFCFRYHRCFVQRLTLAFNVSLSLPALSWRPTFPTTAAETWSARSATTSARCLLILRFAFWTRAFKRVSCFLIRSISSSSPRSARLRLMSYSRL